MNPRYFLPGLLPSFQTFESLRPRPSPSQKTRIISFKVYTRIFSFLAGSQDGQYKAALGKFVDRGQSGRRPELVPAPSDAQN